MDSIASTLNAIKEIELDGHVYKLSSVTLNDLAAYENHLKHQRVEEVCKLDMDKKDIRDMVADIQRQKIDPDELTEQINTISGVRFLIWRCVNKHNPQVTIEDIGDKIDLKNMETVIGDILEMPEGGEGEQGEKKYPST